MLSDKSVLFLANLYFEDDAKQHRKQVNRTKNGWQRKLNSHNDERSFIHKKNTSGAISSHVFNKDTKHFMQCPGTTSFIVATMGASWSEHWSSLGHLKGALLTAQDPPVASTYYLILQWCNPVQASNLENHSSTYMPISNKPDQRYIRVRGMWGSVLVDSHRWRRVSMSPL